MSFSFWIIRYTVEAYACTSSYQYWHPKQVIQRRRSALCDSAERRCDAQLLTVDGPGRTSVSTSLQPLKLVDLCWACLVSNDRLLLINGLEPILRRWVQHKPHALNMTMPHSAARAGETERWREREKAREREINKQLQHLRWPKNRQISTKLPTISLQSQKYVPAVCN